MSKLAEMKFAWIPPGHFLMGRYGSTENPQHLVTITKGFWMSIYPVTQGQWKAVMGFNPSYFRGDDRPVEVVSWLDCQVFCQELSRLTSKPIRLPTEAEWEYACRAGSAGDNGDYWNGNGEEALKKIAWYKANSEDRTHAVGEKNAPNPWSLHDVHGNVLEWCSDWFGNLDDNGQIDPTGPASGERRVARGGTYSWGPDTCRSDFRHSFGPKDRYRNVGLRICFSQIEKS